MTEIKTFYIFVFIMLGFWLLLFTIKLYYRKDIFKHVKKKYGKDISDVVRSFEKNKKICLNKKTTTLNEVFVGINTK